MQLLFNLSLRNFLKTPGLNILNILGLSLGIIAALLILTYADHELSFDEFHPKSTEKYRMEGRTNGDQWFSNLGMEHARELSIGSYPEVLDLVMVNTARKAFLQFKETKVIAEDIIQTNPGSNFFEFFGLEVVEGDEQSMLKEPRSAVITERTASKLFGNTSPLGQFLQYQDTISLKVTGILKDLPTNTHLQFDVIYINRDLYQNEHFHTQAYIELAKGADVHDLEQKILDMDVAFDEYHELSDVKLVSIEDIYMESDASFGGAGKGDPLQLRVFIIIGILILLIAISNYTNLSLAIFLEKGRAIGVRKVFGESRGSVFSRLICESCFVTFLTIPIILIGFSLLLPTMNTYLQVKLENKLISDPIYILGTITSLVIIGFLSASFPAYNLSRSDVGTLMKTKSAMNITGSCNYRNGLILLQFLLLFTLGISGWFMNKQIQYLDAKDMGFNASQVIKVTNAYEIGDFSTYELLKTKLQSYPQIGGVAFGPMMGDGMSPLSYSVEGSSEKFENLLSYGVDIDYFDVMDIEITHGDFKNVLLSSESGQIVSLVNKSFIDRFGWSDEPIGKKITLRPGSENELNRSVSGVFTDFHFFTLKEKIAPQIISLRLDPQFVNTNILIKYNTDKIQEVIELIEDEWYSVVPHLPISYELMDEAVKSLYLREKQTGRISILFSMLAIALSILGMIGFMIYLIGLKAKELTMRKILGASLFQIVGVLNQQLWFFILTAGLVGSLFSYFLVTHWLQDYAYAISMSIWVFPTAIVLVYILVFGITAFRSILWANTNPAITLNSE